ncbi:MAG: hypothetical protein KY396_07965, partial [Actinobacteria bacterium]|nr:hypothetical protein [Actinomycetota bacterium]
MPHEDDTKAAPAMRSKTSRSRTTTGKRGSDTRPPEPPVVRLEIYAASAPVKQAKSRRRKTESMVRLAPEKERDSGARGAQDAALAERETKLAAAEAETSERESRVAAVEAALAEREARV